VSRRAAVSRVFEAVLVWTPDRLTRVAPDGVRPVDKLAASGVCVLLAD
jgi:hypothetical protein